MENPWANQHFGAGGSQSVHLLPGSLTNSFRAKLVRKAIENSNPAVRNTHFRFPALPSTAHQFLPNPDLGLL
jgi:hypothetical protein